MLSPSTEDVLVVLRRALNVLTSHDLDCCLIGGLASSLYGAQRAPKDVDIVVLSTRFTAGELKKLIADSDHSFYLRDGLKGDYKVLWNRARRVHGTKYILCKVDILLPGSINIPKVPIEHVVTLSGFPTMPVIPLLLLKLMAWDEHRNATEFRVRQQMHTDADDIDALLTIARQRGENAGQNAWLPADFIKKGQAHIETFVRLGSRKEPNRWEELGFDVTVTEITGL